MCVESGAQQADREVPKPESKSTEIVASPENDRRRRRDFTPEYKARILAEADACTERGELGALLRREGIYSSHLATWRKQRERTEGLARRKPGPKPAQTAAERTIARLEREKAKLEKELRISRALIELQKKAHEVLGLAQPETNDEQSSSSTSSDPDPRRSR